MSAEELALRLESMDRSLKRLELSVIGDETFGQRGLVKRMGCIEQSVASLHRKAWYWGGAVAGASAGVGLLLKLL
jgi:hypothetical protein